MACRGCTCKLPGGRGMTSDVSPWPLRLGLRGLALAKNLRPKSWRTTMFTMNFHRLEWIIFQDPRTLLTYRANTGDSTHYYISCQWWVMLLNCACILVRVLEKRDFITSYFIVNLCIGMAMALALGLWPWYYLALALSVLALLTSLHNTTRKRQTQSPKNISHCHWL